MDWVKLAIPLIAIAIWILSNLANQRENQRRPQRTLPPRPPDPADEDSKKTGTNLDQFVEELRRRQQKPADIPPSPPPRKAPPPRVARPVVAAPRPDLTETARPASALPAPPPPTRYEIDTALSKDKPSTVRPLVITVGSEPAAGKTPEIVASAIHQKPTMTGIKTLLALLKKPESLATAVLLREVLDVPVSRRRSRRV